MATTIKPLIYFIIIVSFSNSVSLADSSCTLSKSFSSHKVTEVFDGDTVRLANRKKLRFIGINTPETEKKSHNRIVKAEPYADAARNALKALLAKYDYKIQIVKGKSAQDKYGRLLAHVFVNNSINVQAYLLKQGLAFYMPVGPNNQFQSCYRNSQRYARQSNKGIWSSNYYQAINATSISDNTSTGFRIVHGKIQSVKVTRNTIWINFQGNQLAARISAHDRSNFNLAQINALRNKQVTISGYLLKHKRPNRHYGNFIILLKHPDMILQ